MVLSEAIEQYGQFIRHELRHADSTCHTYLSWQRNLGRWQTNRDCPIRG